LYDNDPRVLEEAPARMRANFKIFLDLNLTTADHIERSLSRVSLCKSLEEGVSGADLVIEAVSERLPLKRQIFSELEKYVPAKAILCSNTSAISITLIPEFPRKR